MTICHPSCTRFNRNDECVHCGAAKYQCTLDGPPPSYTLNSSQDWISTSNFSIEPSAPRKGDFVLFENDRWQVAQSHATFLVIVHPRRGRRTVSPSQLSV